MAKISVSTNCQSCAITAPEPRKVANALRTQTRGLQQPNLPLYGKGLEPVWPPQNCGGGWKMGGETGLRHQSEIKSDINYLISLCM